MKQSEFGAREFHDAVLIGVDLDWLTGVARVRVRLCGASRREVEIRVLGANLLHCPRRHPWGHSEYVNEVRGGLVDGRGNRLEIEVQSGDVLELEGDALQIALAE